MLCRTDIQTRMEPLIPSGSSFIKPDLIVETANQLWILDVSVVAGYRMEDTWDIKTTKYGRPDHVTDIRRWAVIPDTIPVYHLPVVISNRGLFYRPSGEGLRVLGLSHRGIMGLCLLAISGSLKGYDLYMRGTKD